MVFTSSFWQCQIGGNASICPNISKAVASIDDGSSNILFTTYYGAMPILDYAPRTTGDTPSWCNGGIPQLANYSLHARNMARDLDSRIPADYSGLIVFDYEAWWPTWNATTNELYKNASRALARSQLPAGASDAQVEANAIADFDAASIKFFSFTATRTKELRPMARVGIYSGVLTSYWHADPAAQAAIAKQQLPWWETMDVIMPSIYLPYSSACANETMLEAYVKGRLSGAVEVNSLLAAQGKPRKPIVPYTWYRYHPEPTSPSSLQLLGGSDVGLEFFGAQLRSIADHAIIWGSEAAGPAGDATLAWFKKHERDFDAGARAPSGAPRACENAMVTDEPPRVNAPRGPPIDPRGPVPPFMACGL